MEPILATTQATILVSSQILTSYILDINTWAYLFFYSSP
jgi:hypothetical protein